MDPYPFFWGGLSMIDPSGYPFGSLVGNDLFSQQLPEEVREALETRRDEVYSVGELRSFPDEATLKPKR